MFDVNYPLMYFLATMGLGIIVFLCSLFFKNKTRKLLRVIGALLLLVSAIFWVQAERFEATVSEKLQRGG
jgi:hydrogenase/urease accessory protein HupE